MILRAAGALARARGLQFGDNFVDCRCRAFNWMRDWAAAEGTESFSVSRKIHCRNRYIFALDVTPDINLGPIEQRLHTNVLAFCRSSRKLSPKFRWLIFIVPFELGIPRREISLFRASWIFIASNSCNQCVPLVLCQRLLQRHCLQFVRHRHWIMRFVPNPACASFGINFDDKIEVVVLRSPF